MNPNIGDEPLTPRQLEIAKLVCQGLSNDDIAAKVFVAVKTVKFHLTEVLRVCGCKSRAQLINKYLPAMSVELLQIEVETLKARIRELQRLIGEMQIRYELEQKERLHGVLPRGS